MKSTLVKNMLGMRFERLVVLKQAASDSNGNAKWHCQCDCGEKTISYGFNLRNKESKSCGCHSRDILIKNATKHGMSKSPTWTSWSDMKSRCLNKNNVRYRHYGGRGIKICKRWVHSFENFIADMGERPSPNYTIDRINNDGNYEPNNCRWATYTEQNNNRKNTLWVIYKNNKMSLQQSIRAAGCVVTWHTASQRIGRGWTVDKAVETPPNSVPKGSYNQASRSTP